MNMQYFRFLIGFLIVIITYSCQTENNIPAFDDITVAYRNDLPLCENISVDFSEDISNCCTFSFGITFSGSKAPKVLINGDEFTDFGLSSQGVVLFEINICNDDETILEIIGSDANGEEVVCQNFYLTCNTCCAATRLFRFTATNNSDTGICTYRVRAENDSDCSYDIDINGQNTADLLPGEQELLAVTHMINDPVSTISLIDQADDSICKTDAFECGPCCDFGGRISARVLPPDLSVEGCCVYRIRVNNMSECNYELHQDGVFLGDIAAGNGNIDIISVEVCGFGTSNIDIVSPTAGTNLVCLSFELDAVCE